MTPSGNPQPPRGHRVMEERFAMAGDPRWEQGLGPNEPTQSEVLHPHDGEAPSSAGEVLQVANAYFHRHGVIGAGQHEHLKEEQAMNTKGPEAPPSSKTVEERLRSVADSMESGESVDRAEMYDALMLGAKTFAILVGEFYVGHIGQCRIYSTNDARDCSCGLREILHGEVRPQDKS